VRTYAAECASSNVRANLFAPGPTRTRMYLGAFPGVDPETLPTPEDVAKAMLPLCLPECGESGQIYSFREKRFLQISEPA
jgi:NAD(P)-dependent dehydrogenase (short-subunit alcohol dehydrogenase family)